MGTVNRVIFSVRRYGIDSPLGCCRRRFFCWGLSILFAWTTYTQAFLDDSFSAAVWAELGGVWVTHSFVASFTPIVSVVFIAAAKWRRHWRQANAGI